MEIGVAKAGLVPLSACHGLQVEGGLGLSCLSATASKLRDYLSVPPPPTSAIVIPAHLHNLLPYF